MLNVAGLITQGKFDEANQLIDNLQDQFPLLATKIQANAEVLGTGDENERFGLLLFNIQEGNFPTLSDARIAAWAWYSDPSTVKNETNTNRLNQAMILAGSVDKGLLEPLNSYFSRFEDQAKIIIDLDPRFEVFKLIGPDQQLATIKLNLENFKSEFREYKLANPNAGQTELNAKYEELKTKYNEILFKDLETLLDPSSQQEDSNTEFINQNQGLEGVETEANFNEGVQNNESGDFFGNTDLPVFEKKIIAHLTEEMGGFTKENIDKLIQQVQTEKAAMSFTNIAGKAQADRIIRFLTTGKIGYGNKPRIYQPIIQLIDEFEAGAFTDDDSPTTVEVQQGDTLSQLAEEFNVPLKAFMEANNITNADLIRVGDELIVPMVERVNMKEVKNNQIKALNVILKDTDKTKVIAQPKIEDMLLAVGFEPEIAKIMAAVAMAESAGNPMIDTVKSGLDPEKKNEFSIGLLQLNMKDDRERLLDLFDIESEEELYDPIINVIAAKRLYDEQGLGAWGAYTDNSYKQFLKN